MKIFGRRKRSSNVVRFKRRKSRSSPKKKGGSSARRFKSQLRRRKLFRTILLLLSIAGALIVLGGGVYLAARSVIDLRVDQGGDIIVKEGFVVGFEDIPVYPGSEFIFEEYKDSESIRQFLSNGNSVYRLPPETKSSEVKEFYLAELEGQEWNHVNSVPLESEEMKPGDYWVKKGKGVRVYSKLNDVWYESVSVKQAKNGLSDVVKKEIERKLLLATSEYTDLLPDFPWRLQVPTDYIADYRGTEIIDLQAIDFKRIGSSAKVTLEPLGYSGAMAYDLFLDKFLVEYNEREKMNWAVINSIIFSVGEQEAIRATITTGDKIGEAVIVANPRNTVVYVILAVTENDPFLNYIVENIEPASSSY